MDLVLIEWADAYGCSTRWATIDKEITPAALVCRSVGWLIYDGEECKVIVPHMGQPPGEDQQGCGDMTIPVVAIKRIVKLKEPK